MRASSGPLRGVAHRFDNADIGAAATQVAAHPLADLRVRQFDRPRAADVGGCRTDRARAYFAEHCHRRADLSRRAVAALEAVVLDERRLHRMQRGTVGEAFDRRDALAGMRYGERQARVDAPAIDEHRARAALAAIASFLG